MDFSQFSRDILKVFENFSTICAFHPNKRTGNAGFLKVFREICKNNGLFAIFLRAFWKFSQNFRTICFYSSARKINAEFANFCSKSAKIMHFWYFLRQIFKVFSHVSQTLTFFVQMCKELTQSSLTVLENRRKLCIYCNFLNKFFKIFENSPASGSFAPWPPTRPTP